MSQIMRIAVLAMSLVSLFAVMSSAAGAVTWTNTGQTSFTATTGAGTLGSTGTSLNCATASATGTTRTPVSGVGASIAHATIVFASCRLAGVSAEVHCAYALTANTFASGVTSGSLDLTCGVFLVNREFCHVEGSTATNYTNGTAGVLSIPASTSLVVTNGSGNDCALGTKDRGSLTALSFRVTSGTGPVIATD